MKKIKLASFLVVFLCLGINSHSQSYEPTSLHFQKDYQVRNFYNTSLTLSELDWSQDILDESKHPRIHLTSPGCDFKQKGQALKISNKSGREQQSYIKLGKLYNYAAIDMDLQKQSHKSGILNALLTLYKDEDNNFVIAQNSVDDGTIQITLEIFKEGTINTETISAEDFKITDSTYGSIWDFSKCSSCSFVFSNPRIDEESLIEFYSKIEDKEYTDEWEGREKNFRTIIKRLKKMTINKSSLG